MNIFISDFLRTNIMVDLAKQTILQFNNVHIQVGDAADMPYDDASFDIALIFFVTCNLSPNAFTKHFQELHRVLVPGGKAILLIPTDWSHNKLYTKIDVDPTTVEDNIVQILSKLPKNPTTTQVTEAFKDSDDILVTCFAVDAEGDIFLFLYIEPCNSFCPVSSPTSNINDFLTRYQLIQFTCDGIIKEGRAYCAVSVVSKNLDFSISVSRSIRIMFTRLHRCSSTHHVLITITAVYV